MDEKGLFEQQYESYFTNREGTRGYDFQDVTQGSLPVPGVSFKEKLRWWTIDRWKRRKTIRADRDRRIQDILDVKKQHPR